MDWDEPRDNFSIKVFEVFSISLVITVGSGHFKLCLKRNRKLLNTKLECLKKKFGIPSMIIGPSGVPTPVQPSGH